jgi:hypothetical protein
VRGGGGGRGRKVTDPEVSQRAEEQEQVQQPVKGRGREQVNEVVAQAGDDEDAEVDPAKFRTKPCRYFRRGKCNSGDDCKFLHTERSSPTKQPREQRHSAEAAPVVEVKQLPPPPLPPSGSSEVQDSRIRTKPCTYFRRGHCRSGDDCLFLHVAGPEGADRDEDRAPSRGKGNANNKKAFSSQKEGKVDHHKTSSYSSSAPLMVSAAPPPPFNSKTFAVYSTSTDKQRTKEIQHPLEDGRVASDHFEDLDPYVVLVSWEVRSIDFPNHTSIKRGLFDIFCENLGFYETNSPSVLEADVASLCTLLNMKPSEDVHRVIPALRARLNALIDAGLKPNNGLFGDFNAAAAWLNTIYNHECDSMPTSPKEEAAPLVMYFARRPAVFA